MKEICRFFQEAFKFKVGQGKAKQFSGEKDTQRS